MIHLKSSIFILLVYSLTSLGCNKDIQVGERRQETFFEILSRDSSHAVLAVTELQNESFLLLENWYNGTACNLTKISKKGNLLERTEMDVPGSGSGQWLATLLRSGDIVYTQIVGDFIQKYKQDGSLIFSERLMIAQENYYFFKPVEMDDGSLLIPMSTVSFGGYHGYLIHVDQNGNVLNRIQIDMASDLRSIETLEIGEIRGDTALLVASSRPWAVDNAKAKLISMSCQLSTGIMLSMHTFDEQDNSESDYVIGACPTDFGTVCLSSGNRNFNSSSYNPSPEFELFFLNHQGELIERRRYGLGSYNSVPTKILKTRDQGFLICGHINSTRTDHFSGFMLKLDAQGGIEASRIFSEAMMVIFDCIETQDDHFFFGGATVAFGSGKDYADGIAFKTDRTGRID